jgi:L-aminopeptidase/D-esterase-like protein
MKPGPLNLITDVDGLTVGNAHDANVKTGVTVLLAPDRAIAAVDMRGGAPGTRETDALNPAGLNVGIDAIVLSGGSVYGLDAASALTKILGAQRKGYKLLNSDLVAPVIPAAILFDLTNGGDKNWGGDPPYAHLAQSAAAVAAKTFGIGKAGAGFGARAGAYEGGLGSASVVTSEGWQIGALVAVNPFGSPYIPGTKTLWAWPWEQNAEMGGQAPPARAPAPHILPPDIKMGAGPNENTTLAIVATNVALTTAQAQRLAIMAQDGMARAISPIHTPFDGDIVFALSTAKEPLPDPWPLSLAKLGALAADTLARAIGRAVHSSRGHNT